MYFFGAKFNYFPHFRYVTDLPRLTKEAMECVLLLVKLTFNLKFFISIVKQEIWSLGTRGEFLVF